MNDAQELTFKTKRKSKKVISVPELLQKVWPTEVERQNLRYTLKLNLEQT